MKNLMTIKLSAVVALVGILYLGCSKDPSVNQHPKHYNTKNVIIVVVDGARFTETWGLPGRQFIPHRAALLEQGVFCSSFYNDGYCFTNAGHSAMVTGVYQNINNSGLEYPQNPSMFQYWLKSAQHPGSDAWVVATKDKLAILSDCLSPAWQGRYRPNIDCGVAGLGTGYREDSTTFDHARNVLATDHPHLMLINFKQPDAAGHASDSAAYLQGIMDTDNYVYLLWQQVQNDPQYKDVTTLIVTNDHGRHTAGHLDGFVSHTDMCDGCKHIEFFGLGPDFKQNYTCTQQYSQVDIANTVAELLQFQMPTATGHVMTDILK